MKKKIDLNNRTILITGACGFIGYHLSSRLLNEYNNITIVGFDNMNDNYYSSSLKKSRLNNLIKFSNFKFIKGDVSNKDEIEEVFSIYKPSIVVNLAAQAAVRFSTHHPDYYIETNIVGFYNILEACKNNKVDHLIYASSSSVYGNDNKVPFSTKDKVDKPASLYGATMKSVELLAYSYSNLFSIPTTGLRFSPVYGPLGRPDMVYFMFADKLKKGERIKLFNYGKSQRDFTYIDDIVEGITCVVKSESPKSSNSCDAPYAIYNVGSSKSINLIDFVTILKEELVNHGIVSNDYNLDSYIDLEPPQSSEVASAFSDVSEFIKDYGFEAKTSIEEGLNTFVKWYKDYYN